MLAAGGDERQQVEHLTRVVGLLGAVVVAAEGLTDVQDPVAQHEVEVPRAPEHHRHHRGVPIPRSSVHEAVRQRAVWRNVDEDLVVQRAQHRGPRMALESRLLDPAPRDSAALAPCWIHSPLSSSKMRTLSEAAVFSSTA